MKLVNSAACLPFGFHASLPLSRCHFEIFPSPASADHPQVKGQRGGFVAYSTTTSFLHGMHSPNMQHLYFWLYQSFIVTFSMNLSKHSQPMLSLKSWPSFSCGFVLHLSMWPIYWTARHTMSITNSRLNSILFCFLGITIPNFEIYNSKPPHQPQARVVPTLLSF